MDLWKTPTSENTVQFNDGKCKYRSRSYYCQPTLEKKKKKPVRPRPPPIRRLFPMTQLEPGLKEEVFYFKQGGKVPSFRGKTSNMLRSVKTIYYKNTKNLWPGFTRSDHFAVRWSGVLVIKIEGSYSIYLSSDDGSNLYIDNKRIINNDGAHGYRSRYAKVKKLVAGQHLLRVEFFEKTGHAGVRLQYKGADSGKRRVTIPNRALMFKRQAGFKEEVYYIAKMGDKVPNLNVPAAVQRIVSEVNYADSKKQALKGNWKGFTKADNFAVRWSGRLAIHQKGTYKFSLRSDDGSKLYIETKEFVNNDGLHGMRQREGTKILQKRDHAIILEYFENGGAAGMIFKYMGPQTGSNMVFVRAKDMTARMTPTKTMYKDQAKADEDKLKAKSKKKGKNTAVNL
jgi:hypothetical protein